MNTDIVQLLKAGQYKEAEEQAIKAVREFPWNPMPWIYLGEALYQRGYAASAEDVFRRAYLLDPQATWVDTVQETILQSPPGDHRIDIEVLLEVPKVTVTAGLIVKNEMRCIERCLNSIKDAVDEIVIVDTGSTDGTLEFASAFPKTKVVSFEWCDDFAAARNAGLPHMTSDWVIWVDADETLFAEDVTAIRETAGLFGTARITPLLYAGILEKVGDRMSTVYDKARMFPLGRGMRYWGRIHEQAGAAEGGVYAGNFFRKEVRIRFEHDGYEPSVLQQKGKLERNLKLLNRMMEEDPSNPIWWYFAARDTMGPTEQVPEENRNKAVELLKHAELLAGGEPRFGRLPDIQMMLAKLYLVGNELEEAENRLRSVLERWPNYPDARFYLAQVEIRRAYKHLQTAANNLNQVKQTGHTYRGPLPADNRLLDWKADLSLAEVAQRAGNPVAAKAIYLQILQRSSENREAKAGMEMLEAQWRAIQAVII